MFSYMRFILFQKKIRGASWNILLFVGIAYIHTMVFRMKLSCQRYSSKLLLKGVLWLMYDCSAFFNMLNFHIPTVIARTQNVFHVSASNTIIHQYSPLLRIGEHLYSISNQFNLFSCSITTVKVPLFLLYFAFFMLKVF